MYTVHIIPFQEPRAAMHLLTELKILYVHELLTNVHSKLTTVQNILGTHLPLLFVQEVPSVQEVVTPFYTASY